jgi:2-iminobutanoate/2-iminopropanoate deaminase
MTSKTVVREGAVSAGHYSPAVTAGGLCFLAGHLGVDEQERLVGGVEEQTRQALENLTTTLRRAGLERSDVVRASVWVRDYADMPVVNKVYAEYFPTDPPARTAFQTPALPLDAAFEIDAVAVARGAG